jgi:hypothetical protein
LLALISSAMVAAGVGLAMWPVPPGGGAGMMSWSLDPKAKAKIRSPCIMLAPLDLNPIDLVTYRFAGSDLVRAILIWCMWIDFSYLKLGP